HLPALLLEAAGELLIVDLEALVVELLLDVDHLRAREHRGDGEPLRVRVHGHRLRIELEDGHEGHAEDRQRDHDLEQGEALLSRLGTHQRGTSKASGTTRTLPVSGSSTRVQLSSPWVKRTCA